MRAAFALLLALPLAGCMDWEANDATVRPEDVEVPAGLRVSDRAYQVAYAFAANRVGPDSFERLYRVNATLTGPAYVVDCTSCTRLAREPHHMVLFDIVVDGRVVQGTGADIRIWPNGTLALEDVEQPYYALPDCRARPASCVVLVDEHEARAAAEAAGLEPRGCPLVAIFGWSSALQRFTWELRDESCPAPMQDEGDTVIVDATTAKVVGRSGWFMIAN